MLTLWVSANFSTMNLWRLRMLSWWDKHVSMCLWSVCLWSEDVRGFVGLQVRMCIYEYLCRCRGPVCVCLINVVNIYACMYVWVFFCWLCACAYFFVKKVIGELQLLLSWRHTHTHTHPHSPFFYFSFWLLVDCMIISPTNARVSD